ncbi:GNAT family N-acetyltransferase [Streptomyces sp. NBC_01317]|uniref:GNAT family N-acetyltransferase n=1 Tax=Streptomyces sp. NBC_01317 TaxID=2903822 RepID=UPI002E140182|nr:GNAT family N-acetyltransferase [Streptomyces sp. NBC_01317]
MPEVFIRRLSRWQAEQQREDVADVYVEAYHRVHGEEFHDRQEFLRAFAEDVQRTGFDMVVASGGGKPTAHAYGFLLDRAGEWWRGLDVDVPWDIEELTVSGQVFALAELMVLPAYRRGGVATRMVEQLLLRTDAALVTLRVDPANEAAVGALRSWGWTRLGAATPPAAAVVPSVGVGVGAVTDVWCRALTP